MTPIDPYAPPPDLEKRAKRRVLLGAFVSALAYGISARAYLSFKDSVPDWVEVGFAAMSIAFIFGVPLVIGFLTAYLGRMRSFLRAALLSLLPGLASLLVALALAWEGMICIILWLPMFAVLSAVGGLLGCLTWRLVEMRRGRTIVGVMLLFPYGLGTVEQRFEPPIQVRLVETTIDIAASPAQVWKQIVEVPAIQPQEHGFAWAHLIGFPRPVAAITSGIGVGSVREASFERGVLFLEKVTEFRENEALGFTIHADPDTIPAKALDQHVTVGGPYFDVLNGKYRIEQLAGGKVRLHLSSEHRLSTDFNSYAGLWTDFIMRDTQQYILEIVRRRAEADSSVAPR